jgi:iron complex transport system substrate-binding protein
VRGAFAAALVALAFLAGHAPARSEVIVTDGLGRKVILTNPARRILTLAPSITEAAFAVGAGSRVVGASAHSDFPPEAVRLPVVSSSAGIDLEAVARLAPDLVIAWRDSFRVEQIPRLEALGARVYVDASRTLADVPRLLRDVAALAGTDAAPAVRAYESRLETIRRARAGREPISVFLDISHRPLMTVGGRHFMTEALALCGARNVFADLPGAAPLVSWEELIARRPHAILAAGSPGGEAAFRQAWAAQGGLDAVREGRVVYVPSTALGRPSPRVVEGIEALCLAIDKVR